MIQHLVLLLVGEGLLDHALPDDLGQVDGQPVAHLYIILYYIMYHNVSYILYYIILYYIIYSCQERRALLRTRTHARAHASQRHRNRAWDLLMLCIRIANIIIQITS